MVVLDTNIFIYLANGTMLPKNLPPDDLLFSSITKIEALGYQKASIAEINYLEDFLEDCTQIDLNEGIIQRAIMICQYHKIHIPDAIIAATALEHGCVLWTANTEDFTKIDDLRLHNPLTPV